MTEHMKTHKGMCFLKCPQCQKTFTRRHGLKSHYKQSHGIGELPQKIEKVTKKSYLQPSVKTHQCSICNKVLRHGKGNLRRHMENVHKQKQSIIKPKKSNKQHAGRGRVRTRYVCNCHMVFTTKNAITEHISSVHGGDRYVCTICYHKAIRPESSFFTTKRALVLHCARGNHELPDIVEPLTAVIHLWNSDESD